MKPVSRENGPGPSVGYELFVKQKYWLPEEQGQTGKRWREHESRNAAEHETDAKLTFQAPSLNSTATEPKSDIRESA